MSSSQHPGQAQAPEHEHEFEPQHGLPEVLPADERILWQGQPVWSSIAREAFHVRKIAIYFLILLTWRGAIVLGDGGTMGQALVAVAWTLPLAALALGLLWQMGWLAARTTVYTLTDKRVVMRVGIVLGVTFNLPLKQIESAALRTHKDGTADLTLSLSGTDRIAYAHLWPHARPWHLKRPQPMLRSVPQGEAVARLLTDALMAAGGAPRTVAVTSANPQNASSNHGGSTRPSAA